LLSRKTCCVWKRQGVKDVQIQEQVEKTEKKSRIPVARGGGMVKKCIDKGRSHEMEKFTINYLPLCHLLLDIKQQKKT